MGGDNGWISVDERVPEDGQRKLLLVDGAAYQVGTWLRGEWRSPLGHLARAVTHWQDPPAPPKDPADEELEDILVELVGQCSDESSAPTIEERDKIYADTIAEIKQWKGKGT